MWPSFRPCLIARIKLTYAAARVLLFDVEKNRCHVSMFLGDISVTVLFQSACRYLLYNVVKHRRLALDASRLAVIMFMLNGSTPHPPCAVSVCARMQRNIDGLSSVFSKFLTFGEGPTDAQLVNNDEWLSKLSYLDFLREYGPHFTINRMMTYDSVRLRLEREQPLTFLEFNYMLLQAYDFTELYRRYG